MITISDKLSQFTSTLISKAESFGKVISQILPLVESFDDICEDYGTTVDHYANSDDGASRVLVSTEYVAVYPDKLRVNLTDDISPEAIGKRVATQLSQLQGTDAILNEDVIPPYKVAEAVAVALTLVGNTDIDFIKQFSIPDKNTGTLYNYEFIIDDNFDLSADALHNANQQLLIKLNYALTSPIDFDFNVLSINLLTEPDPNSNSAVYITLAVNLHVLHRLPTSVAGKRDFAEGDFNNLRVADIIDPRRPGSIMPEIDEFGLNQILNANSDAQASATLLTNLASLASGSESISREKISATVAPILSNLSPEEKEMVTTFTESIPPNCASPAMIVDVLDRITSSSASITEQEDNPSFFSFGDDQYVATAITLPVGSIISTVGQIASAALSVALPVVGIALGAASGLISSGISAIQEANLNVPRVNLSASNFCLPSAVADFQVSLDFISAESPELASYLQKHGNCKVVGPMLTIFYFLTGENSVGIEAYPSVGYNAQFLNSDAPYPWSLLSFFSKSEAGADANNMDFCDLTTLGNAGSGNVHGPQSEIWMRAFIDSFGTTIDPKLSFDSVPSDFESYKYKSEASQVFRCATMPVGDYILKLIHLTAYAFPYEIWNKGQSQMDLYPCGSTTKFWWLEPDQDTHDWIDEYDFKDDSPLISATPGQVLTNEQLRLPFQTLLTVAASCRRAVSGNFKYGSFMDPYLEYGKSNQSKMWAALFNTVLPCCRVASNILFGMNPASLREHQEQGLDMAYDLWCSMFLPKFIETDLSYFQSFSYANLGHRYPVALNNLISIDGNQYSVSYNGDSIASVPIPGYDPKNSFVIQPPEWTGNPWAIVAGVGLAAAAAVVTTLLVKRRMQKKAYETQRQLGPKMKGLQDAYFDTPTKDTKKAYKKAVRQYNRSAKRLGTGKWNFYGGQTNVSLQNQQTIMEALNNQNSGGSIGDMVVSPYEEMCYYAIVPRPEN